MFELLREWFRRYFSTPEAAILLIALVVGFAFMIFLGGIFAPIIVGLVIAYLLDVVVCFLQRRACCPRWLGVTLVYILFLALLVLAVLVFLPLISKQIAQFVAEVPNMIQQFHQAVLRLPEKYPGYVSADAIHDLVKGTTFGSDRLATIGKAAFSFSLATLPNIVAWLVYLFLVPLLVIFFLKDKAQLLSWSRIYVPEQRGLLLEVMHEMRGQLGNYLRGKVFEMLVVGIVAYIGFIIFHLNYALLLAFLVGLSVLVPYVGMLIVTIPVVIVGLLQFGVAPDFLYMILVYFIIQGLDGNVLVPLLFSEAVNLHPIAIIAAALFFGSIWGFWGLFFAIPLATLVNAVISAWRRHASTHQSGNFSPSTNS